MFTIQQIQQEHKKVKSGADFPAYINALKSLGVNWYQTWVADGHSDYNDKEGGKLSSDSKYEALAIANSCDTDQFEADLKKHQAGGSDYPTFCSDSANAGIEKWIVNLVNMTCTYFDKAGKAVLIENIRG